MQRFSAWLEDEPSGWRLAKLMVYFWLLDLALNYLIAGLLMAAGVTVPKAREGRVPIPIYSAELPTTLVQAALKEEALYRLPLVVVRWAPLPLSGVLGGAAVLSLLFTLAHGGGSVLLQGLGGLLYCLLFLKGGGWNRKLWKPYLVVVGQHLAFNAFNVGVIALAGGTHI